MRKDNNFDFLRFLFAVFVVLSHAYPLSGTDETQQWIYKMTNGQIVLAQIGLSGFFVISGFFIFQSMERSKCLLQYYKKKNAKIISSTISVIINYYGRCSFCLHRSWICFFKFNVFKLFA